MQPYQFNLTSFKPKDLNFFPMSRVCWVSDLIQPEISTQLPDQMLLIFSYIFIQYVHRPKHELTGTLQQSFWASFNLSFDFSHFEENNVCASYIGKQIKTYDQSIVGLSLQYPFRAHRKSPTVFPLKRMKALTWAQKKRQEYFMRIFARWRNH